MINVYTKNVDHRKIIMNYITFKTRLGSSFANLSQNNATTSHGNIAGQSIIKNKDGRNIRKLSDLSTLCPGIESDIVYYQKCEPQKLDLYVKSQQNIIQKSLDILLPYEKQLITAIKEDLPGKAPEFYSLPLLWKTDHPLILSLMKSVMAADNIFYLIDLSSENRLSSASKSKSLRKTAINAINDLFSKLTKNQFKYNQKRSGGLYDIKHTEKK